MAIKIATLFLAVLLYMEVTGDVQSIDCCDIPIVPFERTVNYIRSKRLTNRHFKYVDAVFPGILDPPVVHLKNKRVEPQWHTKTHNGGIKFGTDSQIRSRHIVTPLRELLKIRKGDTREILILSGTHGNELGTNWVEVVNVLAPSAKKRTVRAPWIYDPDFWVDDVQRFMGQIGDEFQPLRSRLRIVDIAEMTLEEFREILYSNKHVILGFCFGWNDRAFRYYLELQPVTSLVNPVQL